MFRARGLTSLMVGAVALTAVAGFAPAAHAAGGCAVGSADNGGAGIGYPPPSAGAGTHCHYRSGGGRVSYHCQGVSIICTVSAGGVTFNCAAMCTGIIPSVPLCALVSMDIIGVGGYGVVADLDEGRCDIQ